MTSLIVVRGRLYKNSVKGAFMKFQGSLPKFTKKEVSKFLNGHWSFPEQMGEKPYVGFIYVIYDKVLNRAYIGKKLFRGHGVVNADKESNWKSYVSSSKLLKTVMKERTKSEFEFICIEQYKTKGTLSYSETWSLCLVEAPTSKLFYNTLIEKVTWNVREAISDRHKERLNAVIKRMREYHGKNYSS
jgi:hypothetical protein